MRSILYRFPDLQHFAQLIATANDAELDLGLPSGESVENGEWLLAIFEVGPARRATSAAARAAVEPDGTRITFEPRDWKRISDFVRDQAALQAKDGGLEPGASFPFPPLDEDTTPQTERSAILARHETGRPVGSGSRVLLVDDDPGIRDVVSAMLEAVGLVVTSVASAEEAFTRARREAFDLLVLDWHLPRMNGLELCKLIRKERSTTHVPVLFLTANTSSQDMVDAFASGADDYVMKPFRAPELGARIFSLLRRAKASP